VLIGWVFFRADTFAEATSYLNTMFSFTAFGDGIDLSNKFYSILLLAVFFSFWGGFKAIENWQFRLFAEKQSLKVMIAMSMFSILFFILSLSSITSSGFNPFIYFRF
jgi:alginate O-acetyltransferase complex protein AlgI